MNAGRSIVRRAVFVAWGCLNFFSAAGAEDAEFLQFARASQGRLAYGMYMAGHRVGWMIDDFAIVEHAGREAARERVETYMASDVGGQESIVHAVEETTWSLDGHGLILAAWEEIDEDGTQTITRVEAAGDELEVSTRAGGQVDVCRVAAPRQTLRMARDFAQWLGETEIGGSTFTLYDVHWRSAQVDVAMECRLRERREILWGGVATRAAVVDIDMQGANYEATFDKEGRALRATLGSLLELRLEDESVVKNLDADSVDLLTAAAVPIEADLGDPARLEALVLEVSDLGDFVFPTSRRQGVLASASGVVELELRPETRPGQTVVLSDEERRRHLEATPEIPCGHESLRELVRGIVATIDDPFEKARRINAWVYGNLAKTYSAGASTALGVLENRAGDCTEHALLFLALARAAGIPAREAGGLVYANLERPVFCWHAWVQVFDGKGWVAMDPTFGQDLIDAAHVTMSEGSENLAWVNVAGRIRLRVVRVVNRP